MYSAIENKFYKPGTDRNKGFEITPILDGNTALVMCYKEWMNPKDLSDLMRNIGKVDKNAKFIPANDDPSTFDIPEGKDVAFIQMKGESIPYWNARVQFFKEFNDYCKEQDKIK